MTTRREAEIFFTGIGDPQEETILEEAQRIVEGPRRETYQHPYDDHTALGKVWAGILSKHLGLTIPDIPAHVVSMMQVGTKVIREVGVHQRDNLVDIGGYAYCAQIEYDEGIRRSRVDTGALPEDPESVESPRGSDQEC